ncbi:MAG: GT4 family glycosyltransferase PelF [Cetobacterium sp.]
MSKICLICEGSYPYVVGGVSSWVQSLISSTPEHEFKILCLVPDEKFIEIKYKLPPNLKEIKNIILNSEQRYSLKNSKKDKNLKSKEFQNKIETLMNFENLDSKEIIKIIDSLTEEDYGTSFEIVTSEGFWRALIEYYKKKYSKTGLNNFYWTQKNIFMTLFQLGQEEIPDADIYHPVSTGYAGFLAALAGYREKGQVVLTEHGIYPREREEDILGAEWVAKDFKSIWINFFYMISRLSYEYSDKIISLFEYSRGLQIENGADPQKCIVVANGIDHEIYSKLKREKKDGIHIGSVLRMVPIKDVKMMIKAYKIVSENVENTHLHLIGPIDENEDYYSECLDMVKHFKLEKDITFTGRTDVKEYYKFLDIQLLSSISEGQPLSILEGLSAGIPCISTDVGNCRELILGIKDIGEAGMIIPPTSYVELANSIIEMCKNKEKMKIFSENGKKIVEKYYTKNQFINNYKEIYKSLIRG